MMDLKNHTERLYSSLNWEEHIYAFSIERKISKGIGSLCKSRILLNEKCTTQLYFAFIHSYLNYWNAEPGQVLPKPT